MKRTLIAATLAAAVLPVQAQTAREKYELQERCGRRAAEVFAKEWGSGISNTKDGGQIIGNYENHYNSRLNKCFYLEMSDSYQRGKAPFRLLRLFDINENREIGTYAKTQAEAFGLSCVVQEKQCLSEEEWRALIRPFMED